MNPHTSACSAVMSLTALLLTALLLTACAAGTPPPELPATESAAPDSITPDSTATAPGDYVPPPQVRNATYVWSAEPGIDLFDHRGRLIRAADEASTIAFYGGLESTYPGFADVLDPGYAERITTRYQDFLIGTVRAHILRIVPTDTGFKATVCYQHTRLATRLDDGTYRIRTFSGGERYVRFDRITDEHHPYTPPSADVLTPNPVPTPEFRPLPPTEHQWSAPTTDLFTDAGWTITFRADLGDTMRRCAAWGRTVEPDTPEVGSETRYTTTPPDTLPAYPGWDTTPR